MNPYYQAVYYHSSHKIPFFVYYLRLQLFLLILLLIFFHDALNVHIIELHGTQAIPSKSWFHAHIIYLCVHIKSEIRQKLT